MAAGMMTHEINRTQCQFQYNSH